MPERQVACSGGQQANDVYHTPLLPSQLAVVLTVVVGVTFIAFSVKTMVDVLLEAALQVSCGAAACVQHCRGVPLKPR